MRHALQLAHPSLPHDVVAVDVNTSANSVYAHNWPATRPLCLSLEHWATPQRLDAVGAHL